MDFGAHGCMTTRALGILNYVGPEENPAAPCYIGQGHNCHQRSSLRKVVLLR